MLQQEVWHRTPLQAYTPIRDMKPYALIDWSPLTNEARSVLEKAWIQPYGVSFTAALSVKGVTTFIGVSNLRKKATQQWLWIIVIHSFFHLINCHLILVSTCVRNFYNSYTISQLLNSFFHDEAGYPFFLSWLLLFTVASVSILEMAIDHPDAKIPLTHSSWNPEHKHRTSATYANLSSITLEQATRPSNYQWVSQEFYSNTVITIMAIIITLVAIRISMIIYNHNDINNNKSHSSKPGFSIFRACLC